MQCICAVATKKLPLSLFLLFSLLLAVVLTPAKAIAQITYTGTAANQNFGSLNVGSTSAAKTFSFSIAAGTSVGSIGVLTHGAPDLDFNVAAGGTCAATSYASVSTCTVNVTFNPVYPGARPGAIVFFSGAGNVGTVLGQVLLQGTGVGPVAGILPAVETAATGQLSSFVLQNDFVVDGKGNIFIADSADGALLEVPVGASTPITRKLTADGLEVIPRGIAIDGAGNLYLIDLAYARVVTVPIGGGPATAITPQVNGEPLFAPEQIIIDGSENIFIADSQNERVVELPAGGGAGIAITPSVDGGASESGNGSGSRHIRKFIYIRS